MSLAGGVTPVVLALATPTSPPHGTAELVKVAANAVLATKISFNQAVAKRREAERRGREGRRGRR